MASQRRMLCSAINHRPSHLTRRNRSLIRRWLRTGTGSTPTSHAVSALPTSWLTGFMSVYQHERCRPY